MVTKRAKALRASLQSFRATKNLRRRDAVRGGGGDAHADNLTRDSLRNLSQDLERNAEPYTILLHGLARLVGAPMPRPVTADEDFNRAAAELFARDARKLRGGFDARQQRNWPSLVKGWTLAAIRDGDIARHPLDDGTIATYEADQICGGPKTGNQHRRTIGGITIDKTDRDVAVHIAPRLASGYPDTSRASAVPADQISLLRNLVRFSQTRGLPAFYASLDNAERVDSLIESEVITAEQASNIYGAFKRQLANGQEAPAPFLAGEEEALGNTSNVDANVEIDAPIEWDAGSYFDLPAGVEWQPISTTRPNLNVVELAKHCQTVSSALFGIPYAVIFADFKGINWSGNRGLVSLTRDALKDLRETWIEPSLDWVWAWWLERALESGRLDRPRGVDVANPDELYAFAWDWPNRPEWPDPNKEEQRNELALKLGTDSLHRISGPHWEQIQRERNAELILSDELYLERLVAASTTLQELQASGQLPDSVTLSEVITRQLSEAEPDATPPQPSPAEAVAPSTGSGSAADLPIEAAT